MVKVQLAAIRTFPDVYIQRTGNQIGQICGKQTVLPELYLLLPEKPHCAAAVGAAFAGIFHGFHPSIHSSIRPRSIGLDFRQYRPSGQGNPFHFG